MTRRGLLALIAGLAAAPALAHHGWRWTADGGFQITGRITQVRLGDPHGVLLLDVAGETWAVEMGPPWRHARAGLTDALLVPGGMIVVRGRRSVEPGLRVIKAESVILDGVIFDLFPGQA